MLLIRRAILVVSVLTSGVATAATPQQIADFFRAVQVDNVSAVKGMVGKEVNANEINPVGGEPALVLAVREGSMRVFDALLAHPGTDLEAKAMNGNTALMMAAFKNNRRAAEALLAKGAQVNRAGWTPLHYAAAAGSEDIARLLIARKAKLDAVSPRESGAYTPLMMAAREGQPAVVRLLLEGGANPQLKNTEGLTAAQIAERAGQTDIAASITSFKR
ncbi:ankyrin repeat domain-containing protein [Massilia sp. IC2-477]|uniref:ankyrin repeat domain-containing protein n=1 Tax=Massilia sp. IC2-477 TaxID=2887198 RepID=UPI001D101FF4|nr:ankyrin repeat domain-containing protein [Massilia sp. IC2-477]MCC2955582.1 ankyrin repeat domain-containing protein [Massilia sp. IC2-477]